MRNRAATCNCCGAREQVGQCVKGRPMCLCETDDGFFSSSSLACPTCGKCPVHCKCYNELCTCKLRAMDLHLPDCPTRNKCRKVILEANEKAEAEREDRLKRARAATEWDDEDYG